MNASLAGRKEVSDHYGLSRLVTLAELRAELAMLKRRGPGDWDDSQRALAARLGVVMRMGLDWYSGAI